MKAHPMFTAFRRATCAFSLIAFATLTLIHAPAFAQDAPTVKIGAPFFFDNPFFSVTLTFSEPVTDFDVSDIIVIGGTADMFMSVGVNSDNEDVYTATIHSLMAPMMRIPTLMITISANAANAAGIGNTAESRSFIDFTVAPMVTITAPPDVSNRDPFPITITFSRDVNNFDNADNANPDIVVTGGTSSVPIVMSGGSFGEQLYTAMITPDALPAGDMSAMITITIPANIAINTFGLGRIPNIASPTETVTYTLMPTAMAGMDRSVNHGETVTLTGNAEGFAADATLTYAWLQTGGTPMVTLSDVTLARPTFTAPDVMTATTLTFSLMVSDSTNTVMRMAMVEITVLPPNVNAGADRAVIRGATVTLTGRADGFDDGVALTFEWSQIDSPPMSLSVSLTGADTAMLTFTAPNVTTATTLTFSLMVSDGTDSYMDMVVITVTPPTPIANAGVDQTVYEGATVTLTGMASNFATADSIAYGWSQIGPNMGMGSGISITNSNTLEATFTAPEVTTALTFSLMVSNGTINSMSMINIVVMPLTVDAGGVHVTATTEVPNPIGTQKVRSGVPIILTGRAPRSEHVPLTYDWTLENSSSVVINGETVMLSTTSTATSTELTATYTPQNTAGENIYLPIGTVLTFKLTATRSGGNVLSDTVIITIGSPQEQTVTIVAEIARAFMGSTVTAISNRLLNAKSAAQVNTAGASWNENSDKTFFSARALSRLSVGGDAQSMKAMLGKSDFQMPFGDAGRSGGGLAFWGSGAYSDLSGESDNVQWDGNLSGFHIGIDRRIKRDSGGDARLGIALSSLSSEVDYSDGTNDDTVAGGYRDTHEPIEQGNYEIAMTTLSPYIGWNRGDVELWASAGFGMGEVQRNIGGAQPMSIASDAQQLTAAFGGNGALFIDGSFDLRLKGELSASQFKLDGSADDIFIAGQTLDATRARIGLYSNHLHKIGVGRKITSTNEIGIRFDGGDGITGSGTEIGGQLKYVNSVSGLVVEGSARGLLGHNGDFNEWGIQGSVAKQNGRDGQGLAFYLTPVYGDVNSGVAELLASGLSGEVDNSAARDYHINLNTRLGYGIAYWGMVTPYSEMVFGARDELRMGVNWKLNSTFNLTLVGEEADVDSVRLLGEVNF